MTEYGGYINMFEVKVFMSIKDIAKKIHSKWIAFIAKFKKEQGDYMCIEIEDLLREIHLPKMYFNNDFDISEKFKEEANRYLKLLRQIDGHEFEKEKQKIIQQEMNIILDDIEKNIKSISNIFWYYENANPKAAQEELDSMMDRMKDVMFIASIDDRVCLSSDKGSVWTRLRITPGNQFYRIRAVDEKSSEIQNNPDELFHIPLSKKAFTNSERFSIAGFPSLYLSSMLPLAWQECGYPSKYYYSEFQYKKMHNTERNVYDEFRFLGLYSPSEIYNWGIATKYNHFNEWFNVISKYMKQYPLLLSCAFVNHSGKVSYKQEYIVPQMLMQWVQRNSEKIQGISYFTCVDTSMFPSEWCAYNIAIPAQSPYDEKKYSKNLRKEFCWSRPKFFEVPLINNTFNKEDRENLYTYMGRIKKFLSSQCLPTKYIEYLRGIEELCACLYTILHRGKSIDMQVMIHMLDLINKYYGKISNYNAEDIIQSVKESNLSEIEMLHFNQSSNQFSDIFNEFVKKDKYNNGVYKIIDKYRHTIWNTFHNRSVIIIFCPEKYKLDKELSWLSDNHLIYDIHLLKTDDFTISLFKKVYKEADISFNELWDNNIENDEWVKQHISDINIPIFIRANDISIYSLTDLKQYDYIQIGFDEIKLKENLL